MAVTAQDELYRIAKERAEGKRPNVPWRKGETLTQRAMRWNAANPLDRIPVPCECGATVAAEDAASGCPLCPRCLNL